MTQRQALLLNLKDVQEGVIALLPLTGAATFREIAEALSPQYAAGGNSTSFC